MSRKPNQSGSLPTNLAPSTFSAPLASANVISGVAANVFSRLWAHYRGIVTDARNIEDAIRAQGETWSQDHVAFRTLPGEHCGAHILQALFQELGFTRQDSLYFEDKQLQAFWMCPPVSSQATCQSVLPKVFISELILNKFSPEFQDIVTTCALQVRLSPIEKFKALASQARAGDAGAAAQLENTVVAYLTQGPAWARPQFSQYQKLRAESEYAAWTLAFGAQANHFTVSVFLMNRFSSLQAFNTFVTTELKIPMNASGGGLVKGTPENRLEQSATLAAPVDVHFQEGLVKLPYAFVEFATRYPLDGKVADQKWHSYYQGFVVGNADKIFESTNLLKETLP